MRQVREAQRDAKEAGKTVLLKEEHQFFSETASIYLQAFREVRAEINAAQQTAAPVVSGAASASFDVKA